MATECDAAWSEFLPVDRYHGRPGTVFACLDEHGARRL
jgi:hypothetical protein